MPKPSARRPSTTPPRMRSAPSRVWGSPIAVTMYGGRRRRWPTMIVPPTWLNPVEAITRVLLTAIASAPAAHSSLTTLARSTYWTTGGAWPATARVPSRRETATPGPPSDTSPAATRRAASSCRKAWSVLLRWAAAVSNPARRRLSWATWPRGPDAPPAPAAASSRARTRCAWGRPPGSRGRGRRGTGRRAGSPAPSAARRRAPATRRRRPSLFPHVALAEEALQVLREAPAVEEGAREREHVLGAVGGDDVGTDRAVTGVLAHVPLELVELLDRADPDAERGTRGRPAPPRPVAPARARRRPVARGRRARARRHPTRPRGGRGRSRCLLRGRRQRQDLVAEELDGLFLDI